MIIPIQLHAVSNIRCLRPPAFPPSPPPPPPPPKIFYTTLYGDITTVTRQRTLCVYTELHNYTTESMFGSIHVTCKSHLNISRILIHIRNVTKMQPW